MKDLQKDIPKLLIDAEQIKQVILNPAINALQAMALDESGSRTITFRTMVRDAKRAIEVGDSGPGINQDFFPKIFDPFFTTKENGVGLGLSIAHKIAAQHDGILSVENVAQGALFSLALPMSSDRIASS